MVLQSILALATRQKVPQDWHLQETCGKGAELHQNLWQKGRDSSHENNFQLKTVS